MPTWPPQGNYHKTLLNLYYVLCSHVQIGQCVNVCTWVTERDRKHWVCQLMESVIILCRHPLLQLQVSCFSVISLHGANMKCAWCFPVIVWKVIWRPASKNGKTQFLMIKFRRLPNHCQPSGRRKEPKNGKKLHYMSKISHLLTWTSQTALSQRLHLMLLPSMWHHLHYSQSIVNW